MPAGYDVNDPVFIPAANPAPSPSAARLDYDPPVETPVDEPPELRVPEPDTEEYALAHETEADKAVREEHGMTALEFANLPSAHPLKYVRPDAPPPPEDSLAQKALNLAHQAGTTIEARVKKIEDHLFGRGEADDGA